MKRFTPQFQGFAWPCGLKVLHVYLLPDLTVDRELAQLTACRFAFRVALSH